MAYTSIIPVRRLDSTVNYVMNKEKTTAVSLEDAIALIPGVDSFSRLSAPTKTKDGDAR